MALMAAMAKRRMNRNNDDLGYLGAYDMAAYEEEDGEDDASLLGGIDEAMEEADDALGARDRDLRKLERARDKAKNKLNATRRKLATGRFMTKRRRRRLEEKEDGLETKLKDLNQAIREIKNPGRGRRGSRPAADRRKENAVEAATPAEVQAMNDGSFGVHLSPAGGRRQMEVPIDFNGSTQFTIAFAAGTAAGTQQSFSGESEAYTYLWNRVVGVKVTGWINAPLMEDGAGTPLKIPIPEQTAQVGIYLNDVTPDGGFNLLPSDTSMILGGPFGATKENVAEGLRMGAIIDPNGKATFRGYIELPFTAAQGFTVTLRGALIVNVLKDSQADRLRR
jgi:hypothetical protein